MALFTCPECKKEISDKVKACPHCGYPFEVSEEVQKVEISSVNIKTGDPKKTKALIYGVVGILLLLAIAAGIITAFNNKKEKEVYNSYIDNLNIAMSTMLEGGAGSETQCNLTAKVWRNVIFEERDPETDNFTIGPGRVYYKDFNDSLSLLYSDSVIMERISKIRENRVAVEPMMKSLQNPPIGMEKCYESITELYAEYLGLTDLAISPSGSLQSYSEDKNDKVDGFLEKLNQLKAQIPEKK